MERRHPTPSGSSKLPADYLKMVTEVFETNFAAGLAELKKSAPDTRIRAAGEIYADEVLMAVTLTLGEPLQSVTAYASVDFDPQASSPTMQDLLPICVDAIGVVYGHLLDTESTESKKRLEQLSQLTLDLFDELPFVWTQVEIEKRKVWIRVDKSNPELDVMADEWLKKNDPDYDELEKKNQRDAEKLFVTGPKNGQGGGTVH